MTMRPEPYRHLESDAIFDALEAFERKAARARRHARRARAGLGARRRRLASSPARARPEHLEPVREALSLELVPAERDEVGSLFPC